MAVQPAATRRPRNWSAWIVAVVLLWSMAYGLFTGWLGRHVASHQADVLAGQPPQTGGVCPF